MTIKVLFFAQLKDWFGMSETFIEFPGQATVRDILLTKREMPWPESIFKFAVNENFVEADYRLKNGDTVALMLPASGG